MIQFSLFTHDYETGKHFDIDQSDSTGTTLINTTAGSIKTALVEKISINHIEELKQIIDDASGRQHLTMGISEHDTVGASYDGKIEGSIARNDKCLKPPNSGNASLMCVDSDDVDESVREQLLNAVIGLGSYACVQTTSSSSNIYHDNGYVYRGVSGLHTFFAVKEGKDIKRALSVFHKRLIMAGYGNHKISGVGGFLERSAVDKMMSGASQPIYMKANLGDGLVQRKSVKYIDGDMDIIDTRKVFKNLTPYENELYQSMVDGAKQSMQVEMDRIRCEWEAKQPSKSTAMSAVNDNVLMGDFIIEAKSGAVNVGDILMAPEKYHGMTCRDPIEPEYGSHTVAKIFCDQNIPVIHSNAHGGCNYRMMDLSRIGLGEGRISVDEVKQSINGVNSGNEIMIIPPVVGDGVAVDTDIYVPTAKYDIHEGMGELEWNATHLSNSGKPFATLFNFKRMMDLYGISISYDVIKKETRILGQNMGLEGDIKDNANHAILYNLCQLNKIDTGCIDQYINQLMFHNQINPVTNWVGSVAWDGKDRLKELFNTLDSESVGGIDYMLFRKWFMGALRLAKGEINKFEHVLIFQASEGGEGKTRWFNKLCPSELQIDGMILDVDNKDKVKDCISHWIVELGELDSTFKKDIKNLMSFLSMSKDNIRLAYGRHANSYRRRTSFFATVNNDLFLVDDSGERRFWPIKVGNVDYTHTIDMQQVWAQVDTMTENEWLNREENQLLIENNKQFKATNPIYEILETYFERDIVSNDTVIINATGILKKAGVLHPNRSQLVSCASWLKSHHYNHVDTHINGKKMKGFIIPKFNEMFL